MRNLHKYYTITRGESHEFYSSIRFIYHSIVLRELFWQAIASATSRHYNRPMGRGNKPKRTFIIEVILKLATYSMAAVQIISIALNNQWYLVSNNAVRYTGIAIAFAGVIIFVTAIVTMRSSWRAGVDASQKTELIKQGIYKFSRNPAFLGFDLFYIGITLAFFNPMQLAFLCLCIFMLHLQIMEEEKFLPTVFGSEYINYKQSTGRYFLFL